MMRTISGKIPFLKLINKKKVKNYKLTKLSRSSCTFESGRSAKYHYYSHHQGDLGGLLTKQAQFSRKL